MKLRRVGVRPLARHWRVSLSVIDVEGDDGSRHERALVSVPRAVAIVPVDGDDVILVRQYRAPLDGTLLEIPAGTMDVEGEAAVDTARRELVEEAGFEAAHLEELVGFHNMAGCSDHLTTVYLATGLTACDHAREGPEEAGMTVERVELDAAVAMIGTGAITDAKTVIGLLLARDRLAGRGPAR